MWGVGLGDSSNKRVKGGSHTMGERISMHPQKPHATSQPWLFSHTHSLAALADSSDGWLAAWDSCMCVLISSSTLLFLPFILL